jgi:hypothetical protein
MAARRFHSPRHRYPLLVAAVIVPEHVHQTPFFQQEAEEDVGREHIRAALNRFRHVLRPPLLELPARHQAVLHGEQRHQHWIANQLPWKREADREHYLEAFRRAGLE